MDSAHLRVCLAVRRASRVPLALRPTALHNRRMKKILVVDDQLEILEAVSYILKTHGYDVADAEDGRRGLELARAFRPDLILCDIMMPDMNGYDVLRAIRYDLDLSGTPFVFLTGKARPEDMRAGMNLGADDYLTKPFSAEELLAAVSTQLEKYGAQRERFQHQIDLLRRGLSTILPHELRTPLTLILAHSSLLLEAYDTLGDDSVLDSIRSIHEAGSRLHRLVENLLIYVELESDESLRLEHPHTEAIHRVVRDAVRRVAIDHHRVEDVEVEMPKGDLKMHPFHLRKLIEELLGNALKFSPMGSLVSVTGRRQGKTLEIVVADRGRGMTEEQIQHAEAYIQFNRQQFEQQGSGLGLAIARRVAKLYNGSVAITSKPRVGTTVHVHLPDIWAPAN